jgi:N-acetylglucosamine kinase-like BadF-type ATPase
MVAAYCLAGADMPPDFARLEPALRNLDLAQELALFNDVLAVFRTGSRRSFGMAVVCGTGFNAGGIDRNGREVRFPALGAVTGDRAGGEYLGEAALGAAFRAWDGRGAPTALQEGVLRAFDVPDMETLACHLTPGQVTHEQIIGLAPLVFSVAASGDEVARELICAQGSEIGVSILAILRRLDLLNTPCEVVLGGSLFYGEGTLLIDRVTELVHQAAPLVEIKRPDMRPVVGAALLAIDRAGVIVDDDFMRTLRATLPEALRVSVETEGR